MAEPEEPEFTNWRDAWDWHAQRAADHFAVQSDDDLVALIEADRLDGYHMIWSGFRANGTLAKSGPVLLAFLRRTAGAAGALFHLLGYPDDPLPALRRRVQWAHDGEAARQGALDELEALLHARLGGA